MLWFSVYLYLSDCFNNCFKLWHNFSVYGKNLLGPCTDPRKDLSFFNVVAGFRLRIPLILVSNGFTPLL